MLTKKRVLISFITALVLSFGTAGAAQAATIVCDLSPGGTVCGKVINSSRSATSLTVWTGSGRSLVLPPGIGSRYGGKYYMKDVERFGVPRGYCAFASQAGTVKKYSGGRSVWVSDSPHTISVRLARGAC